MFTSVNAQNIDLSDNSEVSILTMGPGLQLYDSFGHSAGKLLYKLVVSTFDSFYNCYVRQNRWVKEQVLDLNDSEKQAMFDFLQNNAKPENCEYLYDFFYDNCATKIRDVLIEVLGDELVYKEDHITEEYSFRELIQMNVHWNTWGSLGMDTAIGAVVDKKADKWDYQFLPEYVMKGSANAVIEREASTHSLVKKINSLFNNKEVKKKIDFFLSPLFIFGILGLLIIFITYRDLKKNFRSRYLDLFIFLITGIIGVLLLFLWFATDHSSTLNNYNILWAFPMSLLFIFAISKKKPRKWIRRYIILLVIMLILLCMHWITGVQTYAYGLIPLLIALFIRYLYLLMFLKKN
jgi:hypothetical protein